MKQQKTTRMGVPSWILWNPRPKALGMFVPNEDHQRGIDWRLVLCLQKGTVLRKCWWGDAQQYAFTEKNKQHETGVPPNPQIFFSLQKLVKFDLTQSLFGSQSSKGSKEQLHPVFFHSSPTPFSKENARISRCITRPSYWSGPGAQGAQHRWMTVKHLVTLVASSYGYGSKFKAYGTTKC